MIVAGFGFRSTAGAESLLDALALVVGANKLTHLAAPHDKADASCMRQVAETLQLPVISIHPADLTEIETMTLSPVAMTERGVGSVAEAAALAGAGPNAALSGPRRISTDRLATCAIALGAST